MEESLYKDIKDLETCSCGSVMFTINLEHNLIICNRCLHHRMKPVNKVLATSLFKSKIKCGTKVVVKKQVPPKIKNKTTDLEKKIKFKYNAMVKRVSKSGRECCSYEDFEKWYLSTPDKCFYCGGEFKGIHYKDGSTISVDRKDNRIGYLIHNMVKACYICNSIKNQYLSCGQMKAVAQLLIEMRK